MNMKEITDNIKTIEQLTDNGLMKFYESNGKYTVTDLKDKYDLFGTDKSYKGTLKDVLYNMDLYHTKRIRIKVNGGETYEFRF